MKLVTFRAADGEGIGALHPDGFIVDFAGAGLPDTMQAFIEAGEDALIAARAEVSRAPAVARRSVAEVQLLSPLPAPRRIRDGFLFLEHLEIALAKMGRQMSPELSKRPMYYNCDHTHVFGPDADIPWPVDSDWIDYELEWACIVGKPGLELTREQARDHIFGYTIFNDWSARDLQMIYMTTGSGPGEGKDFANGLGPCIVTADEIADPYALTMTAKVNGELWSKGTTAGMHHHFEDAVAQFSRVAPLVSGEVIGSGTVLNGCGFELDRRLAIGDLVELEVEGIGVLRNRVVRRHSVAADTLCHRRMRMIG